MQQYFKLGGTNYHLKWVKVPGTYLLAALFSNCASRNSNFQIFCQAWL